MKRVRQDDEEEKEEKVDWASLCGDMVRALVHTEPRLLPGLYLVNKGFHAALDTDDPNAPYWEKYFNSVSGYSDYAPSNAYGTWKALVKERHLLTPTYYIKIENPCWPCGHSISISPLVALCYLCKCGNKHTPLDPITSWKPTRLALVELPIVYEAATETPLQFRDCFPHIGSNARTGCPSWFTWNWRLQQIMRLEETNSFTKTIRSVLAAALLKDIPKDQAWKVARFVGFM
jgi:hypothetical protein